MVMFEFFAFIVVLIVFCFITFFIYKIIGSKTASTVFLVVSSIVILHLLLMFLMVFAPALLPSIFTKYAAWIFQLILG